MEQPGGQEAISWSITPGNRMPCQMPGVLKLNASFDYAPPKVRTWNKPNGGRFANVNRRIAGATHDKDLPVGHYPLQLYSQGDTERGEGDRMLEGPLAFGNGGAEDDAWLSELTRAISSGAALLR